MCEDAAGVRNAELRWPGFVFQLPAHLGVPDVQLVLYRLDPGYVLDCLDGLKYHAQMKKGDPWVASIQAGLTSTHLKTVCIFFRENGRFVFSMYDLHAVRGCKLLILNQGVDLLTRLQMRHYQP
jgi:hypothetical protein